MWFLQFMFGFMSFEFWFLCGLWVDFFILFGFLFLCSFGLISMSFGVDFVFLAWFLRVYVLLGFNFCTVWVVISLFFSFVSNPILPDGSDPLNQWLKLPILIRAYGRLRVHFMFTRANCVRCRSTPNPIWPETWTALHTMMRKGIWRPIVK